MGRAQLPGLRRNCFQHGGKQPARQNRKRHAHRFSKRLQFHRSLPQTVLAGAKVQSRDQAGCRINRFEPFVVFLIWPARVYLDTITTLAEVRGWKPRSLAAKMAAATDRKSTRLNSSHLGISYAVFCLKKKK